MAAKSAYSGLVAKLSAVKARVTNLRELSISVERNPDERQTRKFIEKCKLLDSWVKEHQVVTEQILSLDKKQNFDEKVFLEGLIKFDDEVTDIRLVYNTVGPKEEKTMDRRQEESNFVKLPTIHIPVFSGLTTEWTSFISIFKSLVMDHRGLSDVERFQYLRASLRDEPLDLIKGLDISAGNFVVAMRLLNERYENLRKLATVHADRILNLTSMQVPSAPLLRSLVACYRENVEALRNLKVIPLNFKNSSDGLFLFLILVRKLDPITRGNFERSLLTNKEIPSPEELIVFLEKECSALEASSESVVGKPTFNKRIDGGRNIALASEVATECVCCRKYEEHPLYKCDLFISKPPYERKQLVQFSKLCYNCLGNHLVTDCLARSRCRRCRGKHHTLLHFVKLEDEKQFSRDITYNNSALEKEPEVQPSPTELEKETSCAASYASASENVILSTVLLKVQNYQGNTEYIRALLDSGSQACYVTSRCVQRLGLPMEKTNMRAMGLSGGSVKINGQVSLYIQPHKGSSEVINISSLVVAKITNSLPTNPLPYDLKRSLGDLPLADPQFDQPGNIDCLLGADVFSSCLKGGRLELGKGLPVAFETVFGWVIMGPMKSELGRGLQSFVVTCHMLTDTKLDESLQRFWRTEEPTPVIQVALHEQKVEHHFQDTHSRDFNGQYIVRLPFKEEHPELGPSYPAAESRFLALERRLAHNSNLHDMYRSYMQEYLDSDNMEPCPTPDLTDANIKHYYLPHHCVIKPNSSSTKLRVVFDASSKTAAPTFCSLNDILWSGPKLQQDIVDVLMRFRVHPVAIATDIRQMFRRVWIHPDDRDFQLILWRNHKQEPLQTYRLKTVTFGMTCSPYLAMRALLQLTTDEGDQYPQAARVIRQDIFVDDIVTGAASVEEGLTLQKELITLMSKGGFALSKWISNDEALLHAVTEGDRESPLTFNSPDEPLFQILGISWLPKVDSFVYLIKELVAPVTKRGVLSCIARFYDPLGFICPVVMWAKILLQHLWVAGLDWDTALPEQLAVKWNTYLSEIPQLNGLHIPRYLSGKVGSLHGFADASERGYAAVVYFCPSLGFKLEPVLLIAKTKVAPLRNITLPRLELCGAHLLAKLIKFCTASLEAHVNIRAINAWTDSTTALSWIRTPPYNLKTFVATRVSEIQEWVPPLHWRHVPTTENPADCASRGLYPSQLMKHILWLHGPSFIQEPPEQWPISPLPEIDLDNLPERRPNPINVLISRDDQVDMCELWDRFSSWAKLQRVTAYIIRFLHNSREGTQRRSGPLSLVELSIASVTLLKKVQSESFQTDIQALAQADAYSYRLRKLTPFVDPAGLLRVGGRLRQSELSYEHKHPVILPRDHKVTLLIVDYYHRVHLHAGPRLLQSILATKFWIVGGRAFIRARVHKCVICFRHAPRNQPPLMADLPRSRVTPARPFLSISLDYGGPFVIRPHRKSKGRCKAYMCIFVCTATKAVHLELVSDMTTQAFLAALQRFIARRGLCRHIYSDCGSNFKGAEAELRRINKLTKSFMNSESVQDFAAMHEISWHFQPPSAPHFGGLHEAAIKQAKYHLRRVMGNQVLTFEELYTVLTRIEAALNSRPLIPVSSDPSEYTALTPGHFLIGSALLAPPGAKVDVTSTPRTRWRLLQDMSKQFWISWKRDYLHTLIQRDKWYRKAEAISEGSMVIVQEDNSSPQEWQLARVISVHHGTDGVVRVVKLQTARGTLTRPAVKVFPLPKN